MPIRKPLFLLVLLLTAATAAAQTSQPKPQLLLDKPAPEVLATTLDGKPATLAALKGKPVILQFGSITEPVFRNKSAAMEKLAGEFGTKANFILLYAEESHPADTDAALQLNTDEGFSFTAPTSLDERIKLAKTAIEKLTIKNQQVWIDAWNNTSSKRYGNWPNMTFLIDAEGKLVAGWPWADPKKLRGALEAVLAGKPVPAEFQGPRKQGAIAALDPDDMVMGMAMGGGGQGNLALLLDGMKLNDKQRAAIYPPLTQLLADLRNFREQRKDEDRKSPEFAEWQKKLKDSAKTVDEAFKANLSAEDYETAMKALKSGPARRLFD